MDNIELNMTALETVRLRAFLDTIDTTDGFTFRLENIHDFLVTMLVAKNGEIDTNPVDITDRSF